jgi:hypothetical protein
LEYLELNGNCGGFYNRLIDPSAPPKIDDVSFPETLVSYAFHALSLHNASFRAMWNLLPKPRSLNILVPSEANYKKPIPGIQDIVQDLSGLRLTDETGSMTRSVIFTQPEVSTWFSGLPIQCPKLERLQSYMFPDVNLATSFAHLEELELTLDVSLFDTYESRRQHFTGAVISARKALQARKFPRLKHLHLYLGVGVKNGEADYSAATEGMDPTLRTTCEQLHIQYRVRSVRSEQVEPWFDIWQ